MRSEREMLQRRRRQWLTAIAGGVAIMASAGVYALWKFQIF
jgi:hypothetical protein